MEDDSDDDMRLSEIVKSSEALMVSLPRIRAIPRTDALGQNLGLESVNLISSPVPITRKCKVFHVPYTIATNDVNNFLYKFPPGLKNGIRPVVYYLSYLQKMVGMKTCFQGEIFDLRSIKPGDIIIAVEGLHWSDYRGKFICYSRSYFRELEEGFNRFPPNYWDNQDLLFQFPPNYWDNIAPIDWVPVHNLDKIIKQMFKGKTTFDEKLLTSMVEIYNLHQYRSLGILECECQEEIKAVTIDFGDTRWTIIHDLMCPVHHRNWMVRKPPRYRRFNAEYTQSPRFHEFPDMGEHTLYLSDRIGYIKD